MSEHQSRLASLPIEVQEIIISHALSQALNHDKLCLDIADLAAPLTKSARDDYAIEDTVRPLKAFFGETINHPLIQFAQYLCTVFEALRGQESQAKGMRCMRSRFDREMSLHVQLKYLERCLEAAAISLDLYKETSCRFERVDGFWVSEADADSWVTQCLRLSRQYALGSGTLSDRIDKWHTSGRDS